MEPEKNDSANSAEAIYFFSDVVHFVDQAIPLPPGTPATYRPDRIDDRSEHAFLETVLVSFTDTAIPQPPETPARHLTDQSIDWSEGDSVDPNNGLDNVDPD